MSWREARALGRGPGADGLQAGAKHLLAASTEVAPVEDSTLIASADIDLDRSVPAASVFYDTEYAARAHEDLNDLHDPGRQAKYLEAPLVAEAPKIVGLVADHLRRGLHS